MHHDTVPEKIFPLLCPVREYEWIEHWKCEMIYSESGYAELDCIFKTNFPDDGEDIWVVSKYNPPSVIEFVRINKLRSIRYLITLSEYQPGKTQSEWRQVITALNENGNILVSDLSEQEFISEKMVLEKLLNHYLLTKKMFKLQDSD